MRSLLQANRRQGQGCDVRGRPHFRRHPQIKEDPGLEDFSGGARAGPGTRCVDQ